jgi:protoporphyrinogen oxidase
MKKAVIIGAGPAGITAAWELLDRTDIKPVILEQSGDIGGISKTVNYKGNRMDIGGHRFFSKSDRVMNWWFDRMPPQTAEGANDEPVTVSYRNRSTELPGNTAETDPEKTDRVMLIRNRLSRIYFLRKFFDYPITLSLKTLANLGAVRIARIGATYLKVRAIPPKEIVTLEGFFIDRFGTELYETFFKDYTEKVWGVPCNRIPAEWGAQRIKKLSVSKAILHAVKSMARSEKSIHQKNTETSLIEKFLYPKFGPGQMWELAVKEVEDKGGTLIRHAEVTEIHHEGSRVTGVTYRDKTSGEKKRIDGDYIFSTMPVRDLIRAMEPGVPREVKEVSEGLMYRDFITVGLLLKKMAPTHETEGTGRVPDTWIYIQEREVKLGRLQVFNNWSPYMVADPGTTWIGLEYFCNEGDGLWNMDDETFKQFAIRELESIGMIRSEDVIDATLIRVPKTYPAYFGSYSRFGEIREFTDRFENLFLIGRNGMHKYNNQDHSMLTAMTAVDNIVAGITGKENLWNINTEEEYHEEKK